MSFKGHVLVRVASAKWFKLRSGGGMKQFLLGVASVIVGGFIVGFGFIQSGGLDFAADTEHSNVLTKLIGWAREQSITKQAKDIVPPKDLASMERIRRGAGNYDAMCVGCHLSPGVKNSEIRKGLYPVPPNLTEEKPGSDSRLFWIIKHGIKGSGMPAWAKGGMDDEAIWDITAFLNALPKLSASEYQAIVASSDGHSHDGMLPNPPVPKTAPQPTPENLLHKHHKHNH